MHPIEKFCISVRHHPYSKRFARCFRVIRPLYDISIRCLLGPHLERHINGMDRLFLATRFRGISETYEPEVWKHVMNRILPGDVIADVGAFIGLYTIAFAKRVGILGRVYSFEPDSQNFAGLCQNVALNQLEDRIETLNIAIGMTEGWIGFASGHGCESRMGMPGDVTKNIALRSLDGVFGNRRLDILKIDVEGFEEHVLKGAAKLLSRPNDPPRLVYIEVHPYNWAKTGTSANSLLQLLIVNGYAVTFLDGTPVKTISSYGEIVAQKNICKH